MKRIRQTSLNFREGNSDKVYEAELIELGPDQYLVNFRYGKRGASLRDGTKTPQPVPFEPAAKIFKSLLVEKINKGYTLQSGFDPLAGELKAPAPQAAAGPVTAVDRSARLLARLQAYAAGQRPDQVPGSKEASLSRSIQMAGELGLVEATGLLPGLIAPADAPNSQVLNYTIAWALGRLGRPEALAALPRLQEVLPASHAYLLPELELALSGPERQAELIESLRSPELETEEAFTSLGARLAAYAQIEALDCCSLDQRELDYHQHALEWRGLSEGLQPFLDAVDFETDGYAYFEKLPADLRAALEHDDSRYEHLREAIEDLLADRRHQLKEVVKSEHGTDQALYKMALKKIDLKKVLDADHVRGYARQGRLGWIYGPNRTRLIQALAGTGLIPDAELLIERLESYEGLRYVESKLLNPDDLARTRNVLAQDGYLEAIEAAMAGLPLAQLEDWTFYQNHLDPMLRGKIASNAEESFQELVSHRQAGLKALSLAGRDEIQAQFSNGITALYRQSLLDPAARELVLGLCASLAFSAHSFQALRRLYKLAEFRRDYELLALLYHRFETTPPLIMEWNSDTKAFSGPTRDYLRRRMPRLLKSLARRQPELYPVLATEILLRVRDGVPIFAATKVRCSRWYTDAAGQYQRRSSTESYPAFAKLLALGYLLRANSLHYRLKKGGRIWLEVKTNLPENARPEAWPELWDKAPEQALRLLLGAHAVLVNDFALGLLQHQADFCRGLSLEPWLALVVRPFENTAAFAFAALEDRLDAPGVMAALLQSPLAGIRARGLQALGGSVGKARLAKDLELAALLLCSPYPELRDFLQARIAEMADIAAELCNRAVDRLMLLVAKGQDLESVLPGVRDFLSGPLRGKTSRQALELLLAHADGRLQRLGAHLLSVSDFAYAELVHLLPLLESADDPELRAAALRLLARLPAEQQAEQAQTLLSTLLNGEDALRAAARELLLGLKQPAHQRALFAAMVPWLFRSQAEGPGEDLIALVAGFDKIYAGIDKNLLWRLLTARSKLAQQAGSLIVVSRTAAEFSLHQLVILSRHASLGVRTWALNALQNDPRVADAKPGGFESLLEVLDNPWEDTRAAAIAWLRGLPPGVWTPERTIAVCDQVYDDVQRFGRDLVSSHFDAGHGEDYLLRLSQHPSRQVQLFVSGFLATYASGNPGLLLRLRPYFTTVLAQVNRGRVVKERVLSLLRKEAETSEPVAAMLAELLAEQSLTAVVADKARYLEALFALQQQDPALPSPLRVISPRKAVK